MLFPSRRGAAANLALASFVAMSSPLTTQAQQHAHQHGAARLGVAVQDRTVTLQLESPLDSLLGFEHRPKTAAQRAAAEALLARMKSPGDLFRFDAAAGCSLVTSKVESAALAPAKPAAAAAESEHADLDAMIEFGCARPDLLRAVDIGLFQAFPRLARLEIDVATDKGQFKRTLKRPERTLRLTR